MHPEDPRQETHVLEARRWRSPILAAIAAVLAALLSGGSLVVQLTDDDRDGRPDGARVEVRQAPPAPAGDLEAAADAATATGQSPADAPLRDDTPEEIPADTLTNGLEQTDELGERLSPRPVAGAQNYSCRQDFSGRVYSSYSIKPTLGVLHYTVSSNVRGWNDVLGIQGYFKRTRVASADRIVDFEGHCLQMVPITTGKAWTQGGANNATCFSYEIIATGRETRRQWLESPLIRRGILAAMTRDDAARCGIPLRRVDPVGCTFPPGITDHLRLECGNDHTDVAPAFPWDVFLRQLQDGPDPAPANVRTWCRKLHWWRRAGRPGGRALANARERKALIQRRGYVCRGGRASRR